MKNYLCNWIDLLIKLKRLEISSVVFMVVKKDHAEDCALAIQANPEK